MSLLSKLAEFWSSRLTAAAAARQLADGLRSATPDLAWTMGSQGPGAVSVGLPGRLIVQLEDCGEAVRARVLEPGQPGDDDPAFLLRAGYDITNLIHSLSWRARIVPGTVMLHCLRANAVYEVVTGFTDHHGGAFAAGTRLTFVRRSFLPYHGGHTLEFREATVYLHEDDDVCRQFERFFAVARPR